MKLSVLKNEERMMNWIMFWVNVIIPIVAFMFVMLFIEGTIVDASVFSIVIVAIIVKIFEKQFGKYAKYIYVSLIGALGPFVIVFANDGKFGAMTQAYMLYLIFCIAYYDTSVVLVNAVITIVANVIGFIFFPDSFLLMHNLAVWVFIMALYLVTVGVTFIITGRTYKLFEQGEIKEEKTRHIMENVKLSFDNLKSSSDSIYTTLDQFNHLSHRIADSSKEIAHGSMLQTNEISDSLHMYNELADRINSSEEKVNKTVEYMDSLKENNEIGVVSVRELSDKFGETTEATESASQEIENLSEKSQSVANIIEVINEITQQTNLLALNAAIEAARAGEFGKGFAVVASEIKKLSEQSTNSTHKVADILTDITNIVGKAREAMDNNKKIVKESNDKLEITVNAFNNIVCSSKEVVQITTVLDEELKNIRVLKDQLLDLMKKLEVFSNNSVESTKEVSASTEEQVISINNIIESMELVQNSISSLSVILNEDSDYDNIKER